jgi:hypothetical protein
MRTTVLLLAALATGPSIAASQEPAPRPVLVDDVPEGTNWIANARTRSYYAVGCPITLSIPAADKLYYKNESSLKAAGFTKSSECNSNGPVIPSPEDTGAVSPPVGRDSVAAATPAPPQQQQKARGKHVRRGFWFNAGLGYGSLGCRDCGDRRESLSGALALGGSPSQKVILGAGTNWWTDSENGATLTVSTLTAVIRFYPSATGGFFLLGGLGVGTLHTELSGFGSDTETGFGVALGLGWDIRVGRNISLTPFWNGFSVEMDDMDTNVGQLGLGLTVH